MGEEERLICDKSKKTESPASIVLNLEKPDVIGILMNKFSV